MGSDIALTDRVVEVIVRSGSGERPSWSVGSGFVMRDGVVLTAAHVVAGAVEIVTRVRGAEEHSARLLEFPDGTFARDNATDIALIEIIDAEPSPAVELALISDRPTLGTPNIDDCVAFGFPRFMERERDDRAKPIRELLRADGSIPIGQGLVEGLATLRVQDAPDRPALVDDGPGQSAWQGMSGAVVFRGTIAIGFVSEHHPPAGMNSLTVVPFSWIDRCANAEAWWQALGVEDPGRLPILPFESQPGTAELSRIELLGRYRDLIGASPEFGYLSTPLGGVTSDFYIPRLARHEPPNVAEGQDHSTARPILDVVGEVERLTIVGPAGMGKTELLHDLTRQLARPGSTLVPVFVRMYDLARAPSDQDVLTVGVRTLFGDPLGATDTDRIVGALRALEDGLELVYLLDGLDEVALGDQESLLSRVGRLHRFVLTSRPAGRIDVLSSRSTVYRLEQLDDATVARCIRSWERLEPGSTGLLERIESDDRLAEIARLPQMLGMLWRLWREDPSSIARSRAGLVANEVAIAFDRATRHAGLPDGEEEVVPFRIRRSLQRLALSGVTRPPGMGHTLSRDELLEEFGRDGDPGMMLRFARRTGLILPAGPALDEFAFTHAVYRAYLAGEQLAALEDPVEEIDILRKRSAGEDVLPVAAAGRPRVARTIIERVISDPDLLGMHWRLAAFCMEGLPDPEALAELAVQVVDGVLDGASSWWARDWLAPAAAVARTAHLRAELHERLVAEDLHRRWAAVECIRHLGDSEFVPALMDRLPNETAPAVRSAIVTALGWLHDPAAIDAIWTHATDERASDWRDFHRIGESLARLSADRRIRELIDGVEQIPDAVSMLLGARPFTPEPVASEIAEVLAAQGVLLTTEQDVAQHVAAANDPDVPLDRRLYAVASLGASDTEDAVNALVDLVLEAPEYEILDRAALALRDLEGPFVFADLVDNVLVALSSEDEQLRSDAGVLFIALWLSPASPEFSSLLRSRPAVDTAPDQSDVVRLSGAILAALAGEFDEAGLVELTMSDVPDIREGAVIALGRFGTRATIDVLRERAVGDESPRVRIAARRSIVDLEPGEAVDLLREAISADEPDERRWAARDLGRLGDQAAMPEMLERLQVESDPAVVAALWHAAASVSSGDAPAALEVSILSGLESADPGQRQEAVGALRVIGGDGAIARLADVANADADQSVREDAAEAFGAIAPVDDVLDLIADYPSTDFDSRYSGAIASALSTRDSDTVRRLQAALTEAGGASIVADHAVAISFPGFAFRQTQPAPDRDTADLIDAYDHGDPNVRWEALEQLADRWYEPGVLGRFVTGLLDPHPCIVDRAEAVISAIQEDSRLTSLDDENERLVTEHFSELCDRLEAADSTMQIAWLLALPRFLPLLLEAWRDGRSAVTCVLWDIAERHEIRLFADGRARLPWGEETTWEALPRVLDELGSGFSS